jgi:hypothetical protein
MFLLSFLAGCTEPSPQLVISPNGAVLVSGESVSLTATLFNSSLTSDIAWTSTGGVLSATTGTGVTFRAEQEGTYSVTATAVADPTLSRTIRITVGQEINFSSPDVPSASGILELNTRKTYIVRNLSNLSKDAFFFEAVSMTPLTLTLFNQNGEAIATSNNPRYFSRVRNTDNLLAPQAITTSSICRGPCITVPRRNEGFVLTIENNDAISAAYDLYLYNENLTDTLEDDEPCSPPFSSPLLTPAIEIIPPEPIVRAIETLNDKDCFYSEAKAGEVTLATFESTAIKVELEVYQVRSSVNTRLVGTLLAGPGRENDILTFDPSYPVLIVARSADGRAGPSGSSRYEVNYY